MHGQQNLIPPENRRFQPEQRVRSRRFTGVFVVIGYTNRLPDSTVFIRDALSSTVLTYDVNENTLVPLE